MIVVKLLNKGYGIRQLRKVVRIRLDSVLLSLKNIFGAIST